MLAPSVQVAVFHAGDSLVSSYQPQYEDIYANGEDCGVTCVQGRIELELPRSVSLASSPPGEDG